MRTQSTLPLSQTTNNTKVSIILPAYNEAENISGAIDEISKTLSNSGWNYEILVVDDGSQDDTAKVASAHANDSRVRVLGYDQNHGKGYALRFGVANSQGDFIAFVDSDREIDYVELQRYLSALQHADLAIASKRNRNSKVDVPFMRRFLSLGFHEMARIMIGIKCTDTQSGMKAGRAKALKRVMPLLSVKRYAFDVELLLVAELLKLKIVELPVNVKLDARFSARSILRILVDLMGITYRLRIKRWYQKNIDNPNAQYRPIVKW